MATNQSAIEILIAKDAIRELAMLYSRGVDRQDAALLRTLYTEDATDTHGDTFDGTAEKYVDFLQSVFPYIRYSGHHICNHLIAVDGDVGEGEIYAIAYHIIPDGKGGWMEDLMCVRYLDHYRKDTDGKWRFSKRVVTYDMRERRALNEAELFAAPGSDASFDVLKYRLFARGARA